MNRGRRTNSTKLIKQFRNAQFLKENTERSKTSIKKPSVIGAVIDLGYCLDLLDSSYLKVVKEGYNLLVVRNPGRALANR